uniref:PID domain-containing protein n=1 Tax=Esox lucius TaxID=8010 RepID=A0AAY5KJ86_ESOLU
MDALKSAGRAIIKSPGVPRHTWGTSKHEKLPENWTDTKETLLEGMVFQVKYLGMTLVGQPKGEDMASAAIRRIVATARASAKKFQKVTLTISPKGIIITDTETQDLVENVSIYSRLPWLWPDSSKRIHLLYILLYRPPVGIKPATLQATHYTGPFPLYSSPSLSSLSPLFPFSF